MAHRISTGFDLRKLMLKETYDPNDDGKIALSIIDIDCDLNMGSHNIFLDEGYKVDNVDVEQHKHKLMITNKQDSFTSYTHSYVSGDNEYKILEASLDINSPHLFAYYKGSITLEEVVGAELYYPKVRLYVNDVKKAERTVKPASVGEKKDFSFCDTVDVSTGSNLLVEVRIFIIGDDKWTLEGKHLEVMVFHIEPPM